MNSKRPTDKRTNFPRKADFTKQFKSDWQNLSRSGRHNMRLLKEVMGLLINNDGPLPDEWRDHKLSHDWADYRECHIGGDFLLIYKIEGKDFGASVLFARAGTHAELFKD